MADIVLIHGAWAGSWVWDSLQDGLRDAGHRPHAVDLPGNGSDATPLAEVSLQRYVEHVGALIETLPGPIHLVAHSGGGITATAIAERYAERIAGVTYVAGMMLPSGMGFGELCAELARDFPEVSGIGPYLEAAPGGSRVPGDAASALFFHDAPAQAAITAARRLTVQPDGGRDIAAQWTAAFRSSAAAVYRSHEGPPVLPRAAAHAATGAGCRARAPRLWPCAATGHARRAARRPAGFLRAPTTSRALTRLLHRAKHAEPSRSFTMFNRTLLASVLALFSQSALAADKVRWLNDWLPAGDKAAIYLGVEQGLFAAEGIEVEIASARGGSDVVTKLATNSADFGSAGLASLLQAKAQGEVPVAVAPIYNKQPDAFSPPKARASRASATSLARRSPPPTFSASNVVGCCCWSATASTRPASLLKLDPGALAPMLATGKVDATINWLTVAPGFVRASARRTRR